MEQLTKLWISHTHHGDRKAREDLILHYAPLVRYIVNRLSLKLPSSLEFDDIIGYGTMGLIDAVDRFDLSRKVKFETYALRRIQGQIIDALRALDLMPRSSYRNTRRIQEAVAQLSQHLGRTPTSTEIANHLEIDLDEYHRWVKDSNCIMISLDQPFTSNDGEELHLYDALEDEHTLSPDEAHDRQEMKDQLMAAIQELSKREQLLISLYYQDGLTMKEVGELLRVSESRVSQMHTKIMFALNRHIQQSMEPVTSAPNSGVPAVKTTRRKHSKRRDAMPQFTHGHSNLQAMSAVM